MIENEEYQKYKGKYKFIKSHIEERSKAIDLLLWANFMSRDSDEEYQVIDESMKGYSVESVKIDPAGWGNSKVKVRKKDYKGTRRKHFHQIMNDDDKLEHWKSLIDEFKKMDPEMLRFIVEKKVPLELFATQALNEI